MNLGISNDAATNAPALEYLRSVLPQCFAEGTGTSLKQAWTGIMEYTPDGLPIGTRLPRELGRAPASDNTTGNERIPAGQMATDWFSLGCQERLSPT